MVWAVLIVFLVIIVIVALLSAGGYILQFWGFRLSRQGDTLHVSRGLLTTRQTTIEERRLRGAEISEPLLLRWVGAPGASRSRPGSESVAVPNAAGRS